jgi:hypothetical protein
VDALVVEVRNGEGASHHRYSQALTLRQFVSLQSGAAAAVAKDKCAVFVSADGQYACAVRDNQRKYHPTLRCVAVAWEVRAAPHGGRSSVRLLHSCPFEFGRGKSTCHWHITMVCVLLPLAPFCFF